MELIYTDKNYVEVNPLQQYELDMAIGTDENDFEVTGTIDQMKDKLVEGCMIYMQDHVDGKVIPTEYGGIIDGKEIDTGSDTYTATGRTWQGILEKKILCPDSGSDYLAVSGDANTIIGTLIQRVGLAGIFQANSDTSGITVSSYLFDW